MAFQFHALDPRPFEYLFDLDDADLARHLARRTVVTGKPGAPCRVSLADAEVGETVLLVNFEHLASQSPYRSRHAIFIRRGVPQARPAVDEVPAIFRSRLLSLRGFSVDDMLLAADVVDGQEVHAAIPAMLETPDVAELYVHFAKPGCFGARVTRA